MVRRIGRAASILTVAVVGATIAACSGSPTSSSPAASLTIYAAASLGPAISRAVAAFDADDPGVGITVSTDSSAALATKIEQGAPADLFLSADLTNPQRLVDEGLATGPVVAFATTRLTVIVPPGNPAGIGSPADLARPGVKVVAAGETVPITRYAEELVRNLAAQPGYSPDFEARYAANVVSREDNVAAVVSKIELGEGDAAIVYETDARSASGAVGVVGGIPGAANVTATYGGVIVRSASDAATARAFLDWLRGAGGQAVLAGFYFGPPAASPAP